VEEIARAAPKMGEDQVLEDEARRLTHADELGRLAQELEQVLESSGLARVPKLLAALERLDPTTGQWREVADAAFANVDELAGLAREYAGGIDNDPGRLEQVERRRDQLFRLLQKYGPGVPDVLAARDTAAHELEVLDTADLDLREIGELRATAARELAQACAALSSKRERGAGGLARAVSELLPALGLPGGLFAVALTPYGGCRADGGESVTFLVQLNAGMDPRPLARVASGGELSRVMLALKVVLASHDAIPTLVFDEVDQGIGGEVAARVGAGLWDVAHQGREAARQSLVITHLPQIAARADRQLVVAKAARGGLATSDVQVVEGEARLRELARMLGDPDSATARRHAEELLRTAGATGAARSGTPSPPARGRPRR
jgi:DNA repair protein RecN (Recombination protein N)